MKLAVTILFSCVAALLALGCHSPLTELVVVTRTDLSVPGELDTIRYRIDATAIGGSVVEREAVLVGNDPAELPIVLGLLHENGDPVLAVTEGR